MPQGVPPLRGGDRRGHLIHQERDSPPNARPLVKAHTRGPRSRQTSHLLSLGHKVIDRGELLLVQYRGHRRVPHGDDLPKYEVLHILDETQGGPDVGKRALLAPARTVVENRLREMGASVAVKPVKPTTNKEIRIMQSLEPALSADPQLLRVCGQRFPELRVEALSFPVGAHDDLLDALAGAFDRAPGRYGSSRIRDCDAPEEEDEDQSRRKKLDKLFDDHIPKGNGLRDW